MSGGDEEVARANSFVADLAAEDGFLGRLEAELGEVALAFKQDGFEGRVQQAVDERRRRVVAAGSFAFAACMSVQLEFGGIEIEFWMLFKQRFIDTAELRAANVLVVHRAAKAALLREGERADGLEEMAIGKLATV